MDLASSQKAVAKQEAQILADKRRRNDARYNRTLDAICERYGQDFTHIGDEIDIETGEIVINRGHIQSMQDERDMGLHGRSMTGRLTERSGQDSEDDPYSDKDEDELPEYEDSLDYEAPSSRRSVRFTQPMQYSDDEEDHLASDEYLMSSRSSSKQRMHAPHVALEDRVPTAPRSMNTFVPMPPIQEQSLVLPQPGVANTAGTQMIQQFTTSIAQQIASFVNVLVQQQAQPPVIQSNVYIGPNQQHSTYIKQSSRVETRDEGHRPTDRHRSASRGHKSRGPLLGDRDRLLYPSHHQRASGLRVPGWSRHSISRQRSRVYDDDLWDSEEERIMKRRRLTTPGLGSLWRVQTDRPPRRQERSQALPTAYGRSQNDGLRNQSENSRDRRHVSAELGSGDSADELENSSPPNGNGTLAESHDSGATCESGGNWEYHSEDDTAALHESASRPFERLTSVNHEHAAGTRKRPRNQMDKRKAAYHGDDQEEVDLLAEPQPPPSAGKSKTESRLAAALRQKPSSVSSSDLDMDEEVAAPRPVRPAIVVSSPATSKNKVASSTRGQPENGTVRHDKTTQVHPGQTHESPSYAAAQLTNIPIGYGQAPETHVVAAQNRRAAAATTGASDAATKAIVRPVYKHDEFSRHQSEKATLKIRSNRQFNVPDSDDDSLDELSPALSRTKRSSQVTSVLEGDPPEISASTGRHSEPEVTIKNETQSNHAPLPVVSSSPKSRPTQSNGLMAIHQTDALLSVASASPKSRPTQPNRAMAIHQSDADWQALISGYTPIAAVPTPVAAVPTPVAAVSTPNANNSIADSARPLRSRPRVSYVDCFARVDMDNPSSDDDLVEEPADSGDRSHLNTVEQPQLLKRPVGRPRKHPLGPTGLVVLGPKRPVGRPRKHPIESRAMESGNESTSRAPLPTVRFLPLLAPAPPRPIIAPAPIQPVKIHTPELAIYELNPTVKWGLYYNPRDVRAHYPGEICLNEELMPISTVLIDSSISLAKLLASNKPAQGRRVMTYQYITETPEDDYIVISAPPAAKKVAARPTRQSLPSTIEPFTAAPLPKPPRVTRVEKIMPENIDPDLQPLTRTPPSNKAPPPNRDRRSEKSDQQQQTTAGSQQPKRAIVSSRLHKGLDALDVAIASDPIPVVTPTSNRAKTCGLAITSLSTGRARPQKVKPVQVRRPMVGEEHSEDEVDF